VKLDNKFFTTPWWTEKFALLIRHEDSLSERRFAIYTPLRIVLVAVVLFLPIFFLGFFSAGLFTITPSGNISETRLKKDLTKMRQVVDSLEQQSEIQNEYLVNIKKLLGGDVQYMKTDNPYQRKDRSDTIKTIEKPKSAEDVNIDYLSKADLRLREEMEKKSGRLGSNKSKVSNSSLEDIHLFKPIKGIVSEKFDAKKNHLGIDIVAPKDEPIKATAEGTVVMASWTEDTGYVITLQHEGGLISVYKHCSKLFKKNGEFVKSGEVIALIGNTGKFTTGPHLHFELWHQGRVLNPETLIAF